MLLSLVEDNVVVASTVFLPLLVCFRCVTPVDLAFALDFLYLALPYFLGFGCLCLCLGLVFLALTFVMPYLIFRVLLPLLGLYLPYLALPFLFRVWFYLDVPFPILGFGCVLAVFTGFL